MTLIRPSPLLYSPYVFSICCTPWHTSAYATCCCTRRAVRSCWHTRLPGVRLTLPPACRLHSLWYTSLLHTHTHTPHHFLYCRPHHHTHTVCRPFPTDHGYLSSASMSHLDGFLHDYVRITGSCPLGLDSIDQTSVETCAEVCAVGGPRCLFVVLLW